LGTKTLCRNIQQRERIEKKGSLKKVGVPMRPPPWTFAAGIAGALLLSASLVHSVMPAFGAESNRNSVASTVGLAPSDPMLDTSSGGVGDEPVATTLGARQAKSVLGSPARSATNEDMGRIIDVVVDRAGTPRAAVIDFGGFLGVGSRKVAIDWSAIRFSGVDGVRLDLTRDQVKAAPQYEEGKPVVILGAAATLTHSRITER
jgi:hypothetical protein